MSAPGTLQAEAKARPAASRAAVLFRTHMWDDFIERQYQRVLQQAEDCDVFIMAHNTSGQCNDIPHDRVILFTEDDVLGLGLARAGEGDLLWYNVDYAFYYFHKQNPQYELVVIVEYDVVLNLSLSQVVSHCRDNDIDLLGLEKGISVANWVWTQACLDLYTIDELRKLLLPFGVVSGRLLAHLFQKRLDHSRAFIEGKLTQWPICEAFIPTEADRSGFKIGQLSEIGSTEHFDFAPAIFEGDMPALQGEAFLHPVLDTDRYIRSRLKFEHRTEKFLVPGSRQHQDLSRFPLRAYRSPLMQALKNRVGRLLQQRLRILSPR